LKKILSEIIIVGLLVSFLIGVPGCNVSEKGTTSQTTSTTAVITTTTSLTLTTTITSSVSTSTSSSTQTTTTNTTAISTSVTPSATGTLLKASEIVDAKGNEGLYSSEPARLGVRVSTTMAILPFDQYPTLEQTGELYTVKLTILEIMRGKYALDYLTDFGLFSGFPYYKNLPEDGYEYILATIKFEYYARDLPGNIIYKLAQGHFMSYSGDNVEYDTPFVLPWKTDVFDYDIAPGDIVEIKIAVMVRTDDKKPTLLFKKADRWLGLY
jgi:hypothetical protein